MEDSAFEAIYTGVYIFIFIAALTLTLYMFRNVNELAEISYEYGAMVEGKTIIEVPNEEELSLDKSDAVSYYYNYQNKDQYADDDSSDSSDGIAVEVVSNNNYNNNNYNYYNLIKNGLTMESYQLKIDDVNSKKWKLESKE